jgi:hypothetical protein
MTRNYRILSLGLFLLAVCVWLFPQQLFLPLLPENSQFPGSTISIPDTIKTLSIGLAILCCLWASLALYWSSADRTPDSKTSIVFGLGIVVASYLVMAWTLGSWMIDDAAITFAYSKNLMLGNGLVLHPNLPPEEAYSNSLWMLLVALPLLLGIEVSVAGKFFSLLFGASAVVIAAWLTLQYVGSRFGYRNLLLFTLIAIGAPFVIWSASGLETSIQAFFFSMVVLAAHRGDRGIWLATVCLSGLVLTRPETPLVVASVAGIWALHHWLQDRFNGIWKLWPIVVIPALTFFALLAFRVWYFGDPMPNPYYVKGVNRDFMTVLRGGRYVLQWLLGAGTFILIPYLLMCKPRKWSLAAYVAVAILIGQLGFLAFSGGDWMRGFRFIAPTLPVLAFLLVYSNSHSDSHRSLYINRLAILAIPLLAFGAVRQLLVFEVNPSTPIARVSRLGYGILDLAERMDIENPKIAHHDAGGISYEVGLELVDLAGLGNRYIAKNINEPGTIIKYILIEEKPDFIYGSVNPAFSAGRTGLHKTHMFKKDYVRLEFPDQPHMYANLGPDPLSHIRRERVKPGPGIELVYKGDKLAKVIVSPR